MTLKCVNPMDSTKLWRRVLKSGNWTVAAELLKYFKLHWGASTTKTNGAKKRKKKLYFMEFLNPSKISVSLLEKPFFRGFPT